MLVTQLPPYEMIQLQIKGLANEQQCYPSSNPESGDDPKMIRIYDKLTEVFMVEKPNLDVKNGQTKKTTLGEAQSATAWKKVEREIVENPDGSLLNIKPSLEKHQSQPHCRHAATVETGNITVDTRMQFKRADKGMSRGTYINNNFKPAASHIPEKLMSSIDFCKRWLSNGCTRKKYRG
nr:hypothetical protein [Tanacetum cinerariifolium]